MKSQTQKIRNFKKIYMAKNLSQQMKKIPWLVCCGLFSFILAGCFNQSLLASKNVNTVYTAIFDAGSSGTRLTLYKVIPSNGGYPLIEKLASFDEDFDGIPNDNGINDFLNAQGEIELNGETLPPGCPGVSKLNKLDVAPCVIQPLLIKLEAAIHKLNIGNPNQNLTKSNVRVELFATAGMRTEDIRNGGSHTTAEITKYYDEMKIFTAQKGFSVGEFKTINGNSEEGVWTWINLNDYYFNAFGGNTTISQSIQNPVGNFEVGGSSMQVAFPTDLNPGTDNNVYRVAINGRAFNVYSKTFLGLGSDDTRKYMKAYNYKFNTGGINCYPHSVTNTPLVNENSGIMLYPSNQMRGNKYPFPANLGFPSPKWTSLTASDLNRFTSGNFDSTCTDQYNAIINQVIALDRNNYGTEGLGARASIKNLKLILQSSTSAFYGTDNFFFSPNDLGYAPTTGFNPEKFKSLLLNHCINGTNPTINKRNIHTCPNGIYMYNFLFGKSGMFTNSKAIFAGVLNPRNANKETVLSWTRGYLLTKYAN